MTNIVRARYRFREDHVRETSALETIEAYLRLEKAKVTKSSQDNL